MIFSFYLFKFQLCFFETAIYEIVRVIYTCQSAAQKLKIQLNLKTSLIIVIVSLASIRILHPCVYCRLVFIHSAKCIHRITDRYG